MSIEAMTWAADQQEVKGSTKLVLLGLADYANADGVCWPGIGALARYASSSSRTVLRALAELQDKEFITITHRWVVSDNTTAKGGIRKGHNLYRLNLPETITHKRREIDRHFGVVAWEEQPHQATQVPQARPLGDDIFIDPTGCGDPSTLPPTPAGAGEVFPEAGAGKTAGHNEGDKMSPSFHGSGGVGGDQKNLVGTKVTKSTDEGDILSRTYKEQPSGEPPDQTKPGTKPHQGRENRSRNGVVGNGLPADGLCEAPSPGGEPGRHRPPGALAQNAAEATRPPGCVLGEPQPAHRSADGADRHGGECGVASGNTLQERPAGEGRSPGVGDAGPGGLPVFDDEVYALVKQCLPPGWVELCGAAQLAQIGRALDRLITDHGWLPGQIASRLQANPLPSNIRNACGLILHRLATEIAPLTAPNRDNAQTRDIERERQKALRVRLEADQAARDGAAEAARREGLSEYERAVEDARDYVIDQALQTTKPAQFMRARRDLENKFGRDCVEVWLTLLREINTTDARNHLVRLGALTPKEHS